MIGDIIGIVNGFMSSYEDSLELRKKEILSDWEETYKMPRKKKKRIRKQLIFKYEMLVWLSEYLNF